MILTLIGLAVLAGLVYLAATVPEYAPSNPPYEDAALGLTVNTAIGQRTNDALVENEPVTIAGVRYKAPRPRAGRIAFRLAAPQRLQPEPSRRHS